MIAIQAMVATVSLHTLSVLRVLVEAESEWSKAQKTAANFLNQYLDRGDEQDYQRFLAAIATDFGFNAARQALEKPEPDVSAAAAGLQRVGVHPDDVSGMIFFVRHFRDYGHFRAAIDIWRETDAMLAELAAFGEALHSRVAQGGRPSNEEALRTYLREFDLSLSTKATAFSDDLGAGARALTKQLAGANIGLALFLVGLVVWRVRALFRRIHLFEKALRGEKEHAQVTLQSIGDGVIRVDAKACVEYVNPAAERLIGMTQAATQGRSVASLIRIVDHDANVLSLLEGEVRFDASCELKLVTTAGMTPISVQREDLQASGEAPGAVLVLRDMTRERDLIERLSWQASHDELTGLANRRELDRRLRREAAALAVEGGESAFLLLDLDQFKLVNDTCGHAAGDQLLREVATILKREVGDSGLAARIGGDEFGALLTGCEILCAIKIAEKLRLAIQDFCFVWEGRTVKIGASIGLVPNVGASANAEDVLRAADVACYIAKENGRNRVELHTPTGDEILKRVSEMGWVHKIRAALDKGHLCLHAQPIVPLRGDAKGAHYELLVRMHDEQGKLVAPRNFIPAAERYALMPRIDRFVVNAAFANLAAITAGAGETRPITFAINLSGQSLGDPTFIDFVQSQFDAYDVSPSSIAFEITETIAIANLEAATRFIETFKEVGCRFLLDDFGAGMSSFGYLKRLPVDFLKIDGGFVKDMLNSPVDRVMVDMIVRLARTLGIETVAECVETDEVVEALRALGIDYVQGYAVGRPCAICQQFGAKTLICHSTRCDFLKHSIDVDGALCA
ncbi:diguanylate cyclase (GGDEF)-like protein/PAS domain S-box-containing protein [Rhodoblastus acidophilus]|uniref:EAL domain-containing protein n=1 Tax=Rhodoblastus acidophilus TaxID=1074 RepID=UPI0022243823|nr:EAL domain-containing protein [Rhodoblastus acidophilus]MCW2286152.1 diguanylate cyclase (GGDEF)-like protein/PAS domain S-box-containing protein [Rhodoblastus acidophilus]MCW2335046.1 diguanylate cyclase (GGDEF)-like protein/PAS domain S-box-containing protein [Rhodoblastus acidophilus]